MFLIMFIINARASSTGMSMVIGSATPRLEDLQRSMFAAAAVDVCICVRASVSCIEKRR